MRYLPILLLVAACGGNHAQTATPADVPPLPPDSTTSVELLIQNKAKLGLSDDQIVKLQGMDHELKAENDAVDAQLTDVEEQQSVRFMRTGPVDDGTGDSKGDKKGHGGHGHGGPGTKPRGLQARSTAREDALHAEENKNDAKMLQRAWKLLDPQQQAEAKAILDRNGHEAPFAEQAPN